MGNEKWLSMLLMFMSVVLFCTPVLVAVIKSLLNKRGLNGHKKSTYTTIFSTGCLLCSIWCLRYAVGRYEILLAEINTQIMVAEAETLSLLEEIFNSFVHSLQTFSMDEDYTYYILGGKNMLRDFFGDNTIWATAYGIYASVLNFVAPIAGGAIIFEIIAGIFPKIRLRASHVLMWKEKCYFSELNAASLELAKSINDYYVNILEKSKPVLVFTDSYIDDENEKEYELLLEAKQMGAICVRDDLAHVSKPLLGKINYFLIDENEYENLQSLTTLAEEKNIRYLKKAHVYVFVQSDAYVQIEKRVKEKFNEEHPLIVPVNSYRNLVQNLFVNVPLYEPLIGKTDKTKLNLTILGNGIIGTEAFLSAYWIGQMLITKNDGKDQLEMLENELTINVISKDSEDAFWSKINYINPEIRRTTDGADDILLYNSSLRSKPYCKVNYTQADVKMDGLGNKKTESVIHGSDYIVVALGNDSDNISVAEQLRRNIGGRHLENTTNHEETTNPHVVIAYAVFNTDLCHTLNQKKHYQSCKENETDIYMHAFGSLDQVYSSENVFMSKNLMWAEETGSAYLHAQNHDNHISENEIRSKNEDKNYSYWANLSRAMHVKYKVFSLGWLSTSLFDYEIDDERKADETNKLHRAEVQRMCARFKRLAIINDKKYYMPEDEKYINGLKVQMHCLAWLEHRRWCAFTRTMGYQHTCAIAENKALFGNHKNMPLKLHPCLVESRLPVIHGDNSYILAKFDNGGKVCEDSVFMQTDADLDNLDKLSYKWHKIAEEKPSVFSYDFKMYDYYRYEFNDYLTIEEAADRTKTTPGEIEEQCIRNKFPGAICFETPVGKKWFVPLESVKKVLTTV